MEDEYVLLVESGYISIYINLDYSKLFVLSIDDNKTSIGYILDSKLNQYHVNITCITSPRTIKITNDNLVECYYNSNLYVLESPPFIKNKISQSFLEFFVNEIRKVEVDIDNDNIDSVSVLVWFYLKNGIDFKYYENDHIINKKNYHYSGYYVVNNFNCYIYTCFDFSDVIIIYVNTENEIVNNIYSLYGKKVYFMNNYSVRQFKDYKKNIQVYEVEDFIDISNIDISLPKPKIPYTDIFKFITLISKLNTVRKMLKINCQCSVNITINNMKFQYNLEDDESVILLVPLLELIVAQRGSIIIHINFDHVLLFIYTKKHFDKIKSFKQFKINRNIVSFVI